MIYCLLYTNVRTNKCCKFICAYVGL